MKPQRALTVIIVIQTLALASLWFGRSPEMAAAQLPDPAAQRDRQLDELRQLNEKIDRLTELLASGKVQVRTNPAEDNQ